MTPLTWSTAAGALALLVTSPLAGQSILFEHGGSASGDFMGTFVAGIGDVDGDGVADWVGHAPGHDNLAQHASGAGETVVLSGATGQVLNRWIGATKGAGYGVHVTRLSDLDGDGLGEVVLGVPGATDHPSAPTYVGAVRVYSGAGGGLLLEFRSAPGGAEHFGSSLADMGDVNGDGLPDLAVGAPSAIDPAGGSRTGRVTIHSGADGSVLLTLHGTRELDSFGSEVGSVDDLDADGVRELIVCAPQTDSIPPFHIGAPGYVVIHSGRTGALLRSHTGTRIGDDFGRALAVVGDVSGDGVSDYAIGIPHDKSILPAGSAVVYSGASGMPLWARKGDLVDEVALGSMVVGVGDFNGDGQPDVAMGSEWTRVDGEPFAATHILSGPTGRLLTTLYGTGAPDYAKAVAGLGDLDGDGFGDLAFGDNRADAGGQSLAGKVSVVAGDDLFLSARPFEVDPGDTVELTVRGGPALATVALVLVDVAGNPTFHVVLTGRLDSLGEWQASAPLLANLSGTTATLRAYSLAGTRLTDSSRETLTLR